MDDFGVGAARLRLLPAPGGPVRPRALAGATSGAAAKTPRSKPESPAPARLATGVAGKARRQTHHGRRAHCHEEQCGDNQDHSHCGCPLRRRMREMPDRATIMQVLAEASGQTCPSARGLDADQRRNLRLIRTMPVFRGKPYLWTIMGWRAMLFWRTLKSLQTDDRKWRNLRVQSKPAFLRFAPVHGVDLEEQQWVDMARSPSPRRTRPCLRTAGGRSRWKRPFRSPVDVKKSCRRTVVRHTHCTIGAFKPRMLSAGWSTVICG